MQNIIAAVGDLIKMDVNDPRVASASDKLVDQLMPAPVSVMDKAKRLMTAAEIPARNYAHIAKIANDLVKVVEIAERPENAEMRPKVASLVSKVAGLFAEVDTWDHLAGKSLEQIETAVHSLYSGGKLNDPNTYNFAARGKGHHSKG